MKKLSAISCQPVYQFARFMCQFILICVQKGNSLVGCVLRTRMARETRPTDCNYSPAIINAPHFHNLQVPAWSSFRVKIGVRASVTLTLPFSGRRRCSSRWAGPGPSSLPPGDAGPGAGPPWAGAGSPEFGLSQKVRDGLGLKHRLRAFHLVDRDFLPGGGSRLGRRAAV